MNNLFNLYNAFRANPMQMLMQRFNIPAGLNDPNKIIQHLLNTGQVNQAHVNNAMNMRNNPMIQQLFKNQK